MNSKIKKICAGAMAFALVSVMGTAFAAEETDGYSYLKGKSGHYGTGGEQTFVYSENADDTADTSNYGYRLGKSHAGGAQRRHTDSEDLVEAGIIDQATADAISEYAAKKHEDISAMHGAIKDMTPEERRAAFEEREASGVDSLDELVEAGTITEEQAEAIKNYEDSEQ